MAELAFLAWIVGSPIVGFLGRRRRGGFWGVFFFSIALTPLVISLALLLTRPKPALSTVIRRTALVPSATAEIRPVTVEIDPIAGWLPRLTLTTLVIVWAGVVLLFTLVYWKVGINALANERSTPVTFGSALELSIDVATLGFNAAPTTDMPPLIPACERLVVMMLLVMTISRLAMGDPARDVERVRTGTEEHATRVRDIEASVSRQQAQVAALRARGAPPEAEATRAMID
jgi:hypothetical protein